MNGKQRAHEVRRAGECNGDDPPRPRTGRREAAGQLVRASTQLCVGEPPVSALDGDSLGIAANLLGDPYGNELGGRNG